MSEKRMVKITGLEGDRRDYIEYPPANPAYPLSDYIVGVKWDRYRYHSGDGDMWPITWGKDGTLYAAAGDNKGSPLNVWKVTEKNMFSKGAMEVRKLTQTNDWTLDLVNPMPVDPEEFCMLSAAPTIKPGGLLDIDGTLYMSVEAQNYGEKPEFSRQKNYHCGIMTSTDGGATWNKSATPRDFFTGRLSSCHFLQFGRGYSGARDGYVYAYFPGDEDGCSYWENADYLLLGRVPVESILVRGAWEFFVDDDVWSHDERNAKPVFSYYKMTGADNVSYCAGIDRYILCNYSFIDDMLRPRPIHQMRWPEAYRSQLTMYESPNPWGPWKLFWRDDNWGTYGDYQPSLPTKWMFEDGHLMLMVSAGSWDDYNFVVQKFALRLAGEEGFTDAAKWFDFK